MMLTLTLTLQRNPTKRFVKSLLLSVSGLSASHFKCTVTSATAMVVVLCWLQQ